MLCSHCGEEISQDSKVCPACGKELDNDAPVQQAAEDSVEEVAPVVAEVVEDSAEAEVLDGTAADDMAVEADFQSASNPLDAVKGAAAPIVDSIKGIDLDWAKEGLSAIRERQETLQAISQEVSEIEAAQAKLDELREELNQRLDVVARYDEIQQNQGAVVDAAQAKLSKAERELVAIVAEMHEAQKDVDNIRAIHERLIKPFERDYDGMREQMRAAEKVLAEAKQVVESHSVIKNQYLAQIEANRKQLVTYENEIDRIAKKSSLTMSEKMRMSNQIAMSMAALQQKNMELRDLIEVEEKKVAPDQRKVDILSADKEPLELEFQQVTRDLLRQRELFKKQVAPLQAKLDAVNARIDAKNQEVSDLRADLQKAEAVVILAQDVHDHPEKIDELRVRIADQEAIVRLHQEKKSTLDSREESLRKADNKGKLFIAGIAGVIVLLAVIFAVLG